MAVELDHSFTTDKSIDDNFVAITDLERVVPAVEGGSVLETTGPDAVKAQILLKMGAMSMKMAGTIEIVERAGLRACSWGHAGDGNLHSTFLARPGDADDLRRAEASGQRFGGFVRDHTEPASRLAATAAWP